MNDELIHARLVSRMQVRREHWDIGLGWLKRTEGARQSFGSLVEVEKEKP